MANKDVPDPNNVPGAEGHLPGSGELRRNIRPRDDPAGVGADRDGTDEGQGTDPLQPEQRQELISDAEHGPEDRLSGSKRAPSGVDDAGQEEPPAAPDANDINAQSARRTDETNAEGGTPPNEPANPEAHEGV